MTVPPEDWPSASSSPISATPPTSRPAPNFRRRPKSRMPMPPANRFCCRWTPAISARWRPRRSCSVAQQTFDTRQLLLDQVTALATNKLRSELDVSFAQVALEEGRLLLQKAQNNMDAAMASLSTALGYHEFHQFQLVEQSLAHGHRHERRFSIDTNGVGPAAGTVKPPGSAGCGAAVRRVGKGCAIADGFGRWCGR